MELRGAAAVCVDEVVSELVDAVRAGRPAWLWSDGADVVVIEGGPGDTPADVLRLAGQVTGARC